MSTISDFGDVISTTLPFFPEYTDHGPRHIADVLRTIDGIIPDESLPYISPVDAGVLIVAVLLHDVGMHLTEDGFRSLIDSSDVPCALDVEGWPALWERFLQEATRFSGKQLISLFRGSGAGAPTSRRQRAFDQSATGA
jgi:molecular chaperone HtpG